MSDLVTISEQSEADSFAEPSTLARSAVWIFAFVLKLYPRHFHEEFAEEMLEVFALAASEASQNGIIGVVRYLLRELAELPIALLLEHIYQRRKQSMDLMQFNTLGEIRVARWVARGTSLLIGGFALSLLLFNEDVRENLTPPTLVLGILSLLALVSWRWERVGGTLTLLASPLLFVAPLIQMLGAPGLITPTWLLILISAAMTLSFLIIGWLFLSIAKHAEMALEPGARHDVPVMPKKPSWTYLLIGLLGLLAVVFFVVPLVIPVQQHFDTTALESTVIDSQYLITQLRAAGAVVGIGSATIEQPFLSVAGYELNIDGEIVQAFEYVDISSATAEAVPINEWENAELQEMKWNTAPHFYQVYNVILLYAGNNEDIVAKMEAAFGPPFFPGE